MLALAALGLSCLGFAGLALSMKRHHRELFGRATASGAITARVAGWSCLALSILPCIAGQDVATGFVLWIGLATPAALLVTLAIAYAIASARRNRVGGKQLLQ